VNADSVGGPAAVLGHPEHELEAVAAVLYIVAQVVIEAGVLAVVLFEQLLWPRSSSGRGCSRLGTGGCRRARAS
jgi:hypothetical protein